MPTSVEVTRNKVIRQNISDNDSSTSLIQSEYEQKKKSDISSINIKQDINAETFKLVYAWRNIAFFIFMHLCVPIAIIDGFISRKYLIMLWHTWIGYMAGLGVTAGAHRLWSHSSYKAHWTVRVFLAFWFTLAGQNDIYEWCRDHRVHHKWSETDADPHNSNRGFFFAHMGWLCCKKHPMVKQKGKTIELDDLLKDPIVRFHRKFYKILYPLVVFILPTYATVTLLNESYVMAFIQSMARYCFSLHVTWLVNSAAHVWGYRPYNDKINPRESPFVIWVNILGEGFHNYHHTYPMDYRASEYGWFFQLNATCLFIEILAKLGLAYDLKMANKKVVEAAKNKVLENEFEKLGSNTILKDDNANLISKSK